VTEPDASGARRIRVPGRYRDRDGEPDRIARGAAFDHKYGRLLADQREAGPADAD
jgi:hypothetical protein